MPCPPWALMLRAVHRQPKDSKRSSFDFRNRKSPVLHIYHWSSAGATRNGWSGPGAPAKGLNRHADRTIPLHNGAVYSRLSTAKRTICLCKSRSSTWRLILSSHCEVPCGKLSTPIARTPAQVSAPASCACTPPGSHFCATPAPQTFVASDSPSLGARSSCRTSRAPLRMSRSRRDRRP